MTVEHYVYPSDGIHDTMRTEAHRLGGLANMSEQHHIVGPLGTHLVDCLLDEMIERLRLQVIE